MGTIFSNKCELAIQSILYLASCEEKNPIISIKHLAKRMNNPQEFTSKVMQELVKTKIVTSKRGKNGGFHLAKPASEIYLIDIVKAIDGLEIFNKCLLGFPGCNHNEPCPVHEQWGPARQAIIDLLSKDSLADLKMQTKKKILDIIKQNS